MLSSRKRSTASGASGRANKNPWGEVAPLSRQLASLAVVLDALGERFQAQRLAELDQCVRQRVRLARHEDNGLIVPIGRGSSVSQRPSYYRPTARVA
jgi:hypothetical protein